MRKSIVVLLTFICIHTAYAQTPFLVGASGPTGFTGAAQLTQNASGNVGIGVSGATGTISTISAAAVVSNVSYSTVSPPNILLAIVNATSSPIPASGTSPGSFGVLRANASTNNDPMIDFGIDNNGLVGIGQAPNYATNGNINAHLYLTDQNGDGYPLFASYTHSNAIAMMMDANGWVGIGNYPGVGTTGLGAIPGNGNTNAHLYISDPANDGYPLLVAYSNSATPALFVSGGSNNNYVGIGTATPSTPLDVVGNTTLENDLAVSGNSTLTGTLEVGGVGTFDASVKTVGNTLVAGQIYAGSNTGSGSGTTSGGTTYGGGGQIVSVGLGGAGLDLVNDGYAGWANQIKFMNAPGTLRHIIYDDNSGSSSSTNGNLVIAPGISGGGGNSVVSIMGKVQIGNVPVSSTSAATLATDYSLYVEKGIISEKYKCALSSDATNWSDYVFDKDYKLAPLSEVETYIQKNKHLPGVPSTDDVHCDGIDLAQIDATLLKKIEELTLYMLKQQKEIESLKIQLSTTK